MMYMLTPITIVAIVVAQWFSTSCALRSPSHFIGWMTGGYAAKTALLVIGLYVLRALGMDAKVAAFATIIATTVSLIVEMMVMMRKRTMNVDTPSDIQ